MISLKKLLTEDVNYILKKSPNSIIEKAADLMAGVFRIKFKATRDEKTAPNFEQDIMYVLTSSKNTQYGPASKFSNGDWYYVIGDDTKSSERRLVTDVLLYPKTKLVNVDKGKQTFEDVDTLFKTPPRSSGTVGASDVIRASDFINAINPKAVRFPETLGTGETLIKQLKEILNNTATDAPSSDEKQIVVKTADTGKTNTDSNTVTDKKDDTNKSVDTDKKDDTAAATDTDKKDNASSNGIFIDFKQTKDKTGKTLTDGGDASLNKEYFNRNLSVINDNPDAATAEAFQQLIVQRVLPVPAYDALDAVKTFKKIQDKNKTDGVWGPKSKAVIAELNSAYGINSTGVTKELLDKLFSPLKTESKFSLKSILVEQDLTGFDPSRVKSKTTPAATTTVKKEVPKASTNTTTTTKSTTPKAAVPTKKEPASKTNTTKTSEKSTEYDSAKLLGQRRGIDKIAQKTGGKLYYSKTLKVWYIDLEIRIVRGPVKMDVDGLLHMRDDGTISVTSEGKQIVQGTGSGWSDGGKKLITKTGTYTSKLPAGDAIFDTLFQAIRANAGAWKEKTLNLQIGINRLSFRNLPEQPSLKPKTPDVKAKVPAGKTKPDAKSTTKSSPRRFIQEVAKTLNVTASYDTKLKVWWFDATLLLKRSPAAIDQNAFLHVRDDGTIMLKVKGAKLIQGTGSGWSDGGRRMQVKTFTTINGNQVTKEKTYVSKAAQGPAFIATLLASIQGISLYWSATKSIKAGVYRDTMSNR